MNRRSKMRGNKWLVLGGILSALAALLHLAVIAGGASWYRFVGAPEDMARAAEQGSSTPALITLAIAALLLVWALYAFSGAGIIRRLPLLRTALILISAVYLLRAFSILPVLILRPELVDTFGAVSSLIALAYGLAYATGTWAGWPALRVARPAA
jgi:hypothetical protein